MNHLSLFSGIGALDLAAEWAGFKTVAFVEKKPFCQQVLKKHWPNVPIFGDIRNVTAESLGIEPGTITLLSGGFPCQPFSNAGEQRGAEDDRYLWPEMFRLVHETKPTWVFGENVAGFIGMALDTVLSELEAESYETTAFVLPALAVNAPHRRDRVFVVAHTKHERCRPGYKTGRKRDHNDNGRSAPTESNARERWLQPDVSPVCTVVSNTYSTGRKELQPTTFSGDEGFNSWDVDTRGSQWLHEPAISRMVDGPTSRLDKDRIEALGNAVVPQQIYPILKAIAEIESLRPE